MIKFKYISTSRKGFSLVEVIIVVAILGIITPALIQLFKMTVSGFSGYEASMQLKKTNQNTLNRIYMRIGSSKRVFTKNTNDLAYLARLNLSGSPAVVAGIQLPKIQNSNTLDIGTTNFISADVGNALFFANTESISTTSIHSVDIYRFNFYYLTSKNPKGIKSKESYRIVEWRSEEFADYRQLMNITIDERKQIYNSNITLVWDTSALDSGSAFYKLQNSGVLVSYKSIQINEYKHTILTDIKLTGLMMGTYGYGVSPNTSILGVLVKQVPVYAIESNKFPGGFEVAIAGSSSGRQILLRSVLVAEGIMSNIRGEELQVIATAKDVW